MLQNDIKITTLCVGKKNSAQIYYSHYSKAIESSELLLLQGSEKRH